MNKVLLLAASFFLFSTVAGCGGGSSGGGDTSSQPPPVVDERPGGIWFGTVFNASLGSSWELTGITLDSGESRFIDELGSQYTANINVTGTSFSGSLFAVAPAGSTFINGSPTATGTISGTISERSELSGTYRISTGETGTLSLFYDDTYERTSGLVKTAGTWIDGNGDTYTVQADGTLFGQDSFGCVYNGRLTIIDAAFNAYRVRIDVANCSGFNGTYTGLGTLSDWQAANDNRLFIFQVSNQTWSLTSTLGKL
jgi:hypothetical protein